MRQTSKVLMIACIDHLDCEFYTWAGMSQTCNFYARLSVGQVSSLAPKHAKFVGKGRYLVSLSIFAYITADFKRFPRGAGSDTSAAQNGEPMGDQCTDLHLSAHELGVDCGGPCLRCLVSITAHENTHCGGDVLHFLEDGTSDGFLPTSTQECDYQYQCTELGKRSELFAAVMFSSQDHQCWWFQSSSSSTQYTVSGLSCFTKEKQPIERTRRKSPRREVARSTVGAGVIYPLFFRVIRIAYPKA